MQSARCEAAIDYVAVTAASANFAKLLNWTELAEPTYHRGFKRAEKRDTLGGQCVRCYEPYQGSKSLGTQYEHWVFSGSVCGQTNLDLLISVAEARATRVDVRFDHFGQVQDLRRLRRFVKRVKPKLYTLLMDGDDNATLYLGKGDCRVRIYDKAREQIAKGVAAGCVESEAAWVPAEEHFRFELQLRGVEAALMWQAYCREPAEAFKRGAGRMRAFCGLEVGEWVECQIPAEKPPEAIQTLASLYRQHSSTIVAAADAGVDVVALARQHIGRASRTVQYRSRRRRQAFESEGAASVTSSVVAMLE